MYIYFPSCNFQKQFPDTARKIRSWLSTQPDVTIAGCCKATYSLPAPGDTIVTICLSCMHLLEEARPDVPHISFFEFLLTRNDFPWPDMHLEDITIQDCFRARHHHALQSAVRECLQRINANIIEMDHNKDDELYDGSFLFHPAYPSNIEMAPGYFKEYLQNYITIIPQEKWKGLFEEHARLYKTARIACYCNVCTSAAVEGGAEALHLAELIFAKF